MRQLLKYSSTLLISLVVTTIPIIGQDITVTIIPTPIAETSLEPTPIPENTATVFMPTPTETVFPVGTETLLPTSSSTITTETVTSSSTTATEIPTSGSTTAAETPEPPSLLLQTISGYVYYQNSGANYHGKIEIEIFTDTRVLIARAVADVTGHYQVVAPLEMPFWIVADAPLHRENAVRVLPGEGRPVLLLLGGDLNDDDCITLTDLQLFGSQNVASDINQDGEITIADVAILTGNLQTACEIFARTLPPTPTIAITLTPENTLLPALTWTMASEATLPVTPDTITAVFTETPADITPTETPSPAATWTLTMTDSAPTAFLPAAATVESTPEVTGG